MSIGTHFGAYEVIAKLGEGGMGEVYLARDSKLQRDVALKILPRDVATDPDRIRRFETETRSESALNHPAIVSIFVSVRVSVTFTTWHLTAGCSSPSRNA